MKTNQAFVDPFGTAANPSFYVPRPVTEEALRQVRMLVDRGRRPVALVGPPGIGKTMLLRVLTLQLERRYRMVFVPHPALSAPDLCAWTLSLLGEQPDEDPERALRARAEQEQRDGSALLLVVDDADVMPLATARRLGELARESEGALRLLVTADDDVRAGRFLAALDPEGEEVRLSDSMSPEETARYVEARLDATLAPPAVRARFDATQLARVHASAGGVPRRVNEIASQILEGEIERSVEPSPPAPASAAPETPGATEPAPEPADAPRTRPPPRFEPPLARPEALPDRRFGVAPRRAGSIRRSAPPGLLVPLGVAALVAVAAVVIPLITPRIVRDLSPPADAGVPAPPARDFAFETSPPSLADLPEDEARRGELKDPFVSGPTVEARASREALAARPRSGPPPEPVVPAPEPLSVSVNASPWAEIEVDGLVVGVTPLAGLPLLPGPHVIRARMPDGRTLERRVEVGPETRHFSFQ